MVSPIIRPLLVFDKKFGRRVRDVERREGFWLVSDRAKSVFESIDPDAFAFLRCEVRLRDGSEGPRYWLCDVLPVLDAVDESSSVVTIAHWENGDKYYDFMKPTSLKFNEKVVGEHRIFRLAFLKGRIICDEAFKRGCKNAGLTGLMFRDAIDL